MKEKRKSGITKIIIGLIWFILPIILLKLEFNYNLEHQISGSQLLGIILLVFHLTKIGGLGLIIWGFIEIFSKKTLDDINESTITLSIAQRNKTYFLHIVGLIFLVLWGIIFISWQKNNCLSWDGSGCGSFLNGLFFFTTFILLPIAIIMIIIGFAKNRN